MRCPVCQHDNAVGAKFCSECGTQLELRCPACSTPYETGAKFCSECGTNLAGPTTPAAAPDDTDDLARYVPEELLRKIRAAQSGHGMRGERRTVTMLFADIQGSTAAAEHLDPEEWADIINGAFGHLIEPVYRYEGTLARLQGDAILAFFGAPIAHEDDPIRAVRAGLDILADIRPYTAEVAARHGVDTAVRVGINTGLVVVGEVGSDLRVEYTALGDAINVAARMEQTADPGTVRVTTETLDLLGGVFASEPIGAIEVKGKAEPVPAHRITGLAGRADQPLTAQAPFVGREHDLAALNAVVERLADGLGAVCTVVGEAGIGKSRLLAAMRDEAEQRVTIADTWNADGRIGWLRGRARSYEHNVPYATFDDMLCDWWRRSRGDDCFDLILDAVEAAVGDRDADLAGFLAEIVGAPLPAEQARLVGGLNSPTLADRTTSAVLTYLEAEARRRPLVMVLDDLHWADPLTLALTEHVMGMGERVPLALVLVMRPNRDDPAWRIVEVAARNHAHVNTAIELDALPMDATEQLLESLGGQTPLTAAVRTAILERSNGNPLFVEEIARSLGELGPVTGGGPGPVHIEVPASLSSLLTARLDRLEEGARTIAQVASVVGREFDLDTLAAVMDGVGDEQAIRELLQRGVLEERRRVPVPTYSFRHPLIRDAAYSTVLLKTRRELHGRIARFMEDVSNGAVEQIAHHYVESREPERAFPFLVEAGKKAMRAMALSDAITHFTLALESPPDDAPADQVLAAHAGLGEAYALVPDLNKSSAAFQSLLDYGRTTGKPDIEVTALNRLGYNTAALSGDVGGAMKYLAQARALAESVGDEIGLAEYHMNACFVTSMQGDVEQAVQHDSETARLGQVAGDVHIRLLGLARKAANLASILAFDDAIEVAEEGLELAEGMGDESVYALIACNALGSIAMARGDLDKAMELYDQYVPILDRYANNYGSYAHRSRAELALLRGDVERALAEVSVIERTGQAGGQPSAAAAGIAGRVRVHAVCGMFEGIEEANSEATRYMAQPTGEFLATTVVADFATARLLSGDVAGAQEDFARALTTSSVPARWERARVLLGLTAAAIARGQIDLAGQHLDEVRTYVATQGLHVHESEVLLMDGRLAVEREALDEARMLFDQAARAAGAIGRRAIKGEALAAQAKVLDRQGQVAEADALRARVQGVVEEMANEIVSDELRTSFVRFTSEVYGVQPLGA